MAISASGLYVSTFVDVLDTTQLALDLDLETHKVALFTNSLTTPNFTTDTAYGVSPYNANEVSGTGYTSGGALLTGTTFTGSGGVATFDASDVTWSSSTITGAKGALIYADALAGNNAIVLVNLGSDYSTSNGSLVISWSASGIFALTLAA
ncbi:hypothetical protein [Nonomuraea wenchangensis]|uniref:Uncharacterized protein n=1 Tax=Nonomuraea wenchangensis TaxID=568860 RepID=A0A1I0EUH0_9ACTN|nr:hypothetical protein [Nonomuraea wenchangensis]SET49217.1 hypothetical protein SAMN05421811_103211 [Nonomuraea wenchangensis]